MLEALNGARSSDVPCGGCTACCTSAQFVPVGPDEVDVLTHIPPPLRFPAPHRPEGHYVLGFDSEGRCPMLGDSGCSIYEHRPRACRTYDCRIFAASGVEAGEGKEAVAERVAQWRFEYPGTADAADQEAVRNAASFLHDNGDLLPEDLRPITATQRAVVALESYHVFLTPRVGASASARDPATIRDDVVAAIALRRRNVGA